jgi:hypothetical protein
MALCACVKDIPSFCEIFLRICVITWKKHQKERLWKFKITQASNHVFIFRKQKRIFSEPPSSNVFMYTGNSCLSKKLWGTVIFLDRLKLKLNTQTKSRSKRSLCVPLLKANRTTQSFSLSTPLLSVQRIVMSDML